MKNIKLLTGGRFANLIIDIYWEIYQELYSNKEDYLNILIEYDYTHETTIPSLTRLFNTQYINLYNSSRELFKNQKTCKFDKEEIPIFSTGHIYNLENYIFQDDIVKGILKYFNFDYLKKEYNYIYEKFKNSLVIHFRLTDYLHTKNKNFGFQILNSDYISTLLKYCYDNRDKYNFSNPIYVISDDIKLSKIYLSPLIKKYNIKFHTYNNFFMDWLSLVFSKYIIGSCSSFSITAGILGLTKKLFIPYPYLSTTKLPDIDQHEFLYHNSKIIKTNLINFKNGKNLFLKN